MAASRYEVILGNVSRVIEAEKKEYMKETGQTFFLDADGKILHIVPKEAFVTLTEGYTEMGEKVNKLLFQLRDMKENFIGDASNNVFRHNLLSKIISEIEEIYENSRGN